MTKQTTSPQQDTPNSNEEVIRLELKISELNSEIVELREKVFKQRDEIHTMRNSRVLGKVIKARDIIGSSYTLPRRTINKTRRTIAKFVPDNVRLPLMKNLRKARDQARSSKYKYFQKSIVFSTVENKIWKEGKSPLVSVVIPYYNRADTIDETLSSLQSQTFKNIEIIVVDDFSNDKASIKKLDTLNNVSIIRHKKNQGVAAARNNGIAAAKGKYIVCLDSDDMIEETFIEKATIVLETKPDMSLISTYQDVFGVVNEVQEKHPYEPMRLLKDNMVITAAQFRREAWERSGGYKSDIGYEDWEFWLTLAENGFWGKQIPEALFKYRTSMQSRYVEDKDVHWNNIKVIKGIHGKYKKRVSRLLSSRRFKKYTITSDTALVNLENPDSYYINNEDKRPNILLAMPWMTFGGAETLIYNFCRQTSEEYNITFVTGLSSDNRWEYKFKEISKNIYHLPNIFDSEELYFEFLSNYIKTRNIEILHIVHTDFLFKILPELKSRHPSLGVVVTMFNDRVPNYVSGVVDSQQYIDIFTSDNHKTEKSFKDVISDDVRFEVIPNGVDCITTFNPELFDRSEQRRNLGLEKEDIAVFFVGRLSEEKNPDVFIEIANKVSNVDNYKHVKFFMVGDGPMLGDCRGIINKLKLKNITMLGYSSDIAPYLAGSDVLILPSSVEGFPLSILEAMAMQVAVIASRVGAVPDVIQDSANGMIMTPGDKDSAFECLEILVKDMSYLKSIKKKGRKDVLQKYSLPALGEKYKKLYNQAIQ